MAEHQVLFCPFCREGFAGQRACPVHELGLVPEAELPAPSDEHGAREDDHEDAHDDHEDRDEDGARVAWFALGHGRGMVALGALLIGASLALDFVRFDAGGSLRTYELARARPSLWTLGLIAFTVLYGLARRRTLPALRGLCVLVPMLGVVALVTAALVLLRGFGGDAEPGLAVYAIALGALALLVGGVRLGR